MQKNKPAALVLNDGSVFHGHRIGHHDETWGEVVFNTSMMGYQEMFTDPSYAGQILVLTYPLIGNYGIQPLINESAQIRVRGIIVRDACEHPSHPREKMTLDEYLLSGSTPGLAGVDTRAVTKKIRNDGVMQGLIVDIDHISSAREQLLTLPSYGSQDFAEQVGTKNIYEWVDGPHPTAAQTEKYHIVVVDEGLKYNILRILSLRNCHVTIVPPNTSSDTIQELKPDGVLFSPGPGDPQHRTQQVKTVKGLLGRLPLMGICLGHQVIGQALGAKTFKLKFGHRGGNHPVKELSTGRVSITSQNHGYAIDADGLESEAEVSHINLHDGTVEGLTHRRYPIISIQYHSEASPGPYDNAYLFDQYLRMVSQHRGDSDLGTSYE